MTKKPLKKLLVLLALVSLVCSALAVTAFAENEVGTFNNPYTAANAYQLELGIANANKSTKDYYITLSNDITWPENKDIEIEKELDPYADEFETGNTLCLDLNGKTIDGGKCDDFIFIEVKKGQLRIKDSSSTRSGTIKSGFLNKSSSIANVLMLVKDKATLSIDGGNFIADAEGTSYADVIELNGKAYIYDGCFKSGSNSAVFVNNLSNLTSMGEIMGGYFHGYQKAIKIASGAATAPVFKLTSGVFTSKVASTAPRYLITSDKALNFSSTSRLFLAKADNTVDELVRNVAYTVIPGFGSNSALLIIDPALYVPALYTESDGATISYRSNSEGKIDIPVGTYKYGISCNYAGAIDLAELQWIKAGAVTVYEGISIGNGGDAPIVQYKNMAYTKNATETRTFIMSFGYNGNSLFRTSKTAAIRTIETPKIKTQPKAQTLRTNVQDTVKFTFVSDNLNEDARFIWHLYDSKGKHIPWSEVADCFGVSLSYLEAAATKKDLVLSELKKHTTRDNDLYVGCRITNEGKASYGYAMESTEKVKLTIDHYWTADKKDITAATCTKDGKKLYHCDGDGCTATKTEVLKKLGHDETYESDFAAPECEFDGCTAEIVCDRCGIIIQKAKTIPATGHSYKSKTTKATTSKDGKTVKTCENCSKKVTTTIYKASSIKLSTTSYTYDGKAKTPSVTVKDSKGKTLKKDTDYTVKYASGRKSVGKYTVTVTLKGKYSGTKSLSFTINPKATSKITVTQTTTSIKATWSKVSGATGYKVYIYKGSKLVSSKTVSSKTTSYNFTKLTAGTNYTVKVKTYQTVSKVNYWSSTKSLATATKTKTPSITSVKAGSKSATVKWGNISGENGYQVYYATSKNGTYKKGATTKANDIDATIKSLTKGKTYYFKVRAYKTADSGTVYSAWSAVKSVKVK